MLLIGLGSLFAAIVIGVGIFVVAGTDRAEVARGLAAIDRVYAARSGAGGASGAAPVRGPGKVGVALGALARTLAPTRITGWMQRWLDYAGNPSAWPPERLLASQGLGLVVLGLLGGLLCLVKGPVPAVIGAVVGGLAGFWLPLVLLYDVATRRQQHIQRDLPDALDLLTLSVEAGLGFDAALAQVATTMPGPLAGEIIRVLQEMQMGVRRADALRGLATRTRVPELRTVATAVMQAGELGIPIANVLREQAGEMRLKRRQRAEERAQKVPVKVVIPLILCLFPVLFIVVIGPAVINLLYSWHR